MESLHILCLRRGGGAALIRTQYSQSPQLRGCGGAQAMRPEQAKQKKKAFLPFETDTISLKESPDFLSTTEHCSPQERPSV